MEALDCGGTGPPEWPTVVLNGQSSHAAALSHQAKLKRCATLQKAVKVAQRSRIQLRPQTK
ncbi:hypothetical protein PCASD_17546 [Puccinia coronata f. sp. avenae]|uniref:Uncharacterized protein n=1 Tax=Puccinia coronata f. sp. avenae TaxID=200324 RepID=A0A2N5U3U2_9BASI|nr:hypothetical protein PCASD_17546 [Puccinia coronata f. sp. avenae]